MSKKGNKILVEWLESKDKWNKNRVNILNIGRLEKIVDGGEVTDKLNVKRYRALEISWTSWIFLTKGRQSFHENI